ncbi:UDP-4-amino-4,6-dideoxy-N-acetyl-beta-L-altrosamine transaminase [Emcibacteraceae bacterium Y4]|nr:UDP-4-amino-4,6-dideoxy-N-acetyl-beta-L-altrosamine transaminase [Pseudemcibacter aquimaris]MCC3860399.1 UDP-4-amino-4,6-dideoxy-N-acetyl-beta-L-altrosamine transaminase [Pseudemcibacter aquimaris]WDU57725.1 UDP-4-amino-4,6-dideoxy-N-acetyl-beta-L-altrosamine transaminase [Pseudemcibacter aquimaris]
MTIKKIIPYGKQDINDDDINAVIDVLKSDFVTQGPKVPEFEQSLKYYTGASYAVAVNSGTSALHIACQALEVGKGDIVWTSPITFAASSNAALYLGADVDFVDIDETSYNISIDRLNRKLIEAKSIGRLPKVVIPVHLCGQSCDMAAISELAEKYDFKIIEDASHAIGGKYKNEPIGNSTYSDITVFSFHPVKIVTTAEGGACMTNDENLAKKMELLRSHGITRDENLMQGDSHGPWYYQQIDLGYNYRMTDIQAALGTSQMKRIDDFVKKRNQLAARYDRLLLSEDVTIPLQHDDCYSARHLYIIKLKDGYDHRKIFEKMRDGGIGVNLHYIPVHLQPYYQNLGFNQGDFPAAEDYYSKAITLPLYPTLSEDDQDHVVETLLNALK